MLSKIYKSDFILIMLFVVSVIIDSINGYLQEKGIFTPIGITFRMGMFFLLFPSIFRLSGRNKIFTQYVSYIILIFSLALAYWVISYPDTLITNEVEVAIRILYSYSLIAFFLNFANASRTLLYIEKYATIIAAIIIFSFITGIGRNSYGETYGFGMKGFFIAGNDLGLTLILSLLLSTLHLFKSFSKILATKVLIIAIACFLIGSRVGMFGCMLIIVYAILYYIFFYKTATKKVRYYKRLYGFTLIPAVIFSVLLILNWTYQNIFDPYTQKRLSAESIMSSRTNFVNPAKNRIKEFSTSEFFFGCGETQFYKYIGDSMSLIKKSKSVEADFYEIIGTNGFVLGGLIYSLYLIFTIYSLYNYYRDRTFLNFSLFVFFTLFLIIGFMAGHAIKNVMAAPVYAYAVSLLINHTSLKENEVTNNI